MLTGPDVVLERLLLGEKLRDTVLLPEKDREEEPVPLPDLLELELRVTLAEGESLPVLVEVDDRLAV